jgi:hypothetical protein
MDELVSKLVQLNEAIPERLRDYAARCERPQILAAGRRLCGSDRAGLDQAEMGKLDHVVLEQLERPLDRVGARELARIGRRRRGDVRLFALELL